MISFSAMTGSSSGLADTNSEAGPGAKEASGEGRGQENACGGARQHEDNFCVIMPSRPSTCNFLTEDEELEETDIPGMGFCTAIRGDKEGHRIVPRNVAAREMLKCLLHFVFQRPDLS